MKKRASFAAAGIYLAFLLVGPHGPFSFDQHSEEHPHTHKKHVVKLLRIEERLGKRMPVRKYVPITS